VFRTVLVVFAILGTLCIQSSAGETRLPSANDACSWRNNAMAQYVSTTPRCGVIGVYAREECTPESYSTEYVYGLPWHKYTLDRGIEMLSRQEAFYRALCGIVAMHQELLGNQPPINADSAKILDLIKSTSGVPDALNKAVAEGNINVRTLRKTMYAVNSAVKKACVADTALTAATGGLALASDVQALVASPMVASEQAADAIQAIRDSTRDADLLKACNRLLREIDVGKADYVARIKNLAMDGSLSRIARSEIVGSVAKASVASFLAKIGVKVAGGEVGLCIAAFTGGFDLGMWAFGDTAAYDHARLAHYAEYIRPGLSEYWRRKKDELDPASEESSRRFDSATRAVLLTRAFVGEEAHLMSQAYEHCAIKYGMGRDLSGIPGASKEECAKVYPKWMSGSLFPGYASVGDLTLLGGAGSDWREKAVPGEITGAIAGKTTGGVDVVFCIDATNSMQDDIDEVKSRAKEIIDRLRSEIPSMRLGLVTYRDFSVDGEKHLAPEDLVPLTEDCELVNSRIQSIRVSGGGDPPEDVIDGLMKSLEMKWRNNVGKFVILIGDAQAKQPDHNGLSYSDVAKRAAEIDPVHVYGIVAAGTEAVVKDFDGVASVTGGRVITADSASDVSDAIVDTVRTAVKEHSSEVYAGGSSDNVDWQTPLLISCIVGIFILSMLCIGIVIRRRNDAFDFPADTTVIAWLQVHESGRTPWNHPVTTGLIRLGRGEGNDLVLSDLRASTFHAEVTSDGSRSEIIDLGSANGTNLNGRPMTRHILANGDVIGIGDASIYYLDST
jgi:hypothetical protein